MPGASAQAQTWPTGPPTRVVQGAPAYAEIRPLFLVFWCAKDEPKARFQSLGIWWCWGRMRHKLAQSFDHGRLFNVAFGSSQTDDWLPRYGHLKFRGGVVLQY